MDGSKQYGFPIDRWRQKNVEESEAKEVLEYIKNHNKDLKPTIVKQTKKDMNATKRNYEGKRRRQKTKGKRRRSLKPISNAVAYSKVDPTSTLKLSFLNDQRKRILKQMVGEETWKLSPSEKAQKDIRRRQTEVKNKLEKERVRKLKLLQQASPAFNFGGALDILSFGNTVEKTGKKTAQIDAEDHKLPSIKRSRSFSNIQNDSDKFFPNLCKEKNRNKNRREKLVQMRLKRMKEKRYILQD
eukprot:g10275.t1